MMFYMLTPLLNLVMIALVFLVFNPIYVGFVRFLDNLRKEPAEAGKGVKTLFWSFREGRFSRILSATAWKHLWLMIWSYVTSMIISIPVGIAFIYIIIRAVVKVSEYDRTADFWRNWRLIYSEFLVFFIILGVYIFVAGIITTIIMLNRKYAYMFTDFIVAEQPDVPTKAALNRSKEMTKGLKGRMFLLDLSFIGWHILNLFTFFLLQYWIIPYQITAFHEVYLHRKAELGLPVTAEPSGIGQQPVTGSSPAIIENPSAAAAPEASQRIETERSDEPK